MKDNSQESAAGELELAIVGAGFAGLHMLYRAKQSGRNVRLFEAGGGVGGTWFWNKYPGARVDIESLEYSYSFDERLQQDWEWTERYSPQPELERYANHVADRFDLRPYIQLNTSITSAVFDEQTHRWTLTTHAGEKIVARFCILATGLLYIPKKLPIPGLDTYRGLQLYTSQWPEGTDLTGKRVAVIGTGSTGVQVISELSKIAGHLSVLQRTPSYVIPAHNHKLEPEYVRSIKAEYPAIRERQLETLAGFLPLTFRHDPHPTKSALSVSDEERKAVYDARWAAGGLSFYTAFTDLMFDEKANATCAEYVHAKIRAAVNDPQTAEKLVPRYPIFARRLCTGTNYYETYNRPNVSLIDVNERPIERATEKGLIVGGELLECDAIVFATGFDALTGAIENIDIRGRNGESIKQHWSQGVSTYAALMCAGFPNLIMMNGPTAPSAFWAPIQIAEYQADWIERCIDYLAAHGLDCIEAQREHEDQWMDTVAAVAAPTLFSRIKSWYQGDNIPGKPHRMMVYLGGYVGYRDECEKGAANGYQKFILSGAASSTRSEMPTSTEQLDVIIEDMHGCFGSWTPQTTVPQMRADWDALFGKVPCSVGAKVESVTMNGVPAMRICAATAASDRAVLYLHGGGYILGSPRSHRDLCEFLSREAEAQVFLLDYRLAPEHPFPAAVDDATSAYRWLLESGFDASHIAISGDSAGGGLTFATLLSIRNHRLPTPGCAVALSPWVDLECTGETFTSNADVDPMVSREFTRQLSELYVPSGALTDPLASPLHGDLAGLPPLLVQVGERETLLDDSRRIVAKAREAGVDVTLEVEPGQIHVFQIFASRLDEGEAAIVRMGRFIRTHCPAAVVGAAQSG